MRDAIFKGKGKLRRGNEPGEKVRTKQVTWFRITDNGHV